MRRRHVEKAERIRDMEKHYKCCWRSGGGDWSINRIRKARAARWIKQSARQKRLLYILCLKTHEVKRYVGAHIGMEIVVPFSHERCR